MYFPPQWSACRNVYLTKIAGKPGCDITHPVNVYLKSINYLSSNKKGFLQTSKKMYIK